MKNICLMVAFIATSILSAQTYTVDNKPNAKADFDNLQTAINTVPEDSILLVQGSPNNYGAISIEKKITIKGTGYFLTENPNTKAEVLISKTSTVSLLDGSNGTIITGFDLGPVRFNGNEISNISIIKNKTSYIHKSEGVTPTNMVIKHNYITSYFNNGNNFTISVGDGSIIQGNFISRKVNATNSLITNNVIGQTSQVSYSTVKNNIFTGSWNNFTSLPDVSSPNVTNIIQNNIYYSATGTPVTDEKNNKLSNEVLFIGTDDSRYSSDGQYILTSDSPAKGAGVGGVDCGMFYVDGTDKGYILSGLPDIPSIYEFSVPTTGYSNGSGIQVNIKVKSNN